MRARKPHNLERKLALYGAPIVKNPEEHAGRWLADFMPAAKELQLDLGCGKGSFLAASALKNPDVFFVGIDISEICAAHSAQKLVEQHINNACVICADAEMLLDFFAQNELDRIYLNFNAPFPKKKHAHKRLCHINHLARYRTILKPDGILDMRTDNVLYWQFAHTQLALAGYEIFQESNDLHADAEAFHTVLTSEYDSRTVALGAHIYCLRAKLGKEPEELIQTAPLSLVDYLPEAIEDFEEIPYGMESTLFNMKNRRRNAREKQSLHASS